MSQSNIINLGLFLVTVIGVAVAIWQAWDARSARDAARTASSEAQRHEEAALQASRDSASAATRSAAALEESNEIARKSLPQDPWKFIQHPNNKYELRNDGHDTLWAVSVIEADDVGDITLFQDDPVDQLHPGESIYFIVERTFDSPPSTTVIVTWGFPDSTEQQTWRRTIA